MRRDFAHRTCSRNISGTGPGMSFLQASPWPCARTTSRTFSRMTSRIWRYIARWLVALVFFAFPAGATEHVGAAPDDTLRVITHIAASWVVGNSVVEPLVGVDNENQFVPRLAERWEITDTHMDLHLRQGVVFHDGTPFDSHAVRRNWERYVETAAQVTPYFTLDLRRAVQDVEAVNDFLVRMHFKPNGFVGQMMVYLRAFYIYSPSFFEHTAGRYPPGNQANILQAGPWGTGPYVVRDVSSNGAVTTLERNPDYWRPGFPRTSHLFIYSPRAVDSQSAYQWLIDGKADLFDAGTPSMLPLLRGHAHLNRVITHPTSHLTTLFNTRKPGTPLRDIRVRQALNYLVDRHTLLRYVSRDTARMVAFILPLDQAKGLQPYPFDPQAAQELLRAAGFGPDNPLSLIIGYFMSEERLARAISAMLQAGGVEVELVRYDTRQEYYQRIKNYTHGPDNPIKAERWDLSIVQSGLYTNTVTTHFEAFFSEGGNRWIEIDQRADELFLRAMRARTPKEVHDALANMEIYLHKQHYSMPLFIWPSIFIMNQRIARNTFSGSGYLLNLGEIAIAP
ncbi:MAG: ABC transporter substrate-binding protein [Desulfovibrionales bacterium]|nr:MAG: ABC transporter substrate-binding protein [Desulfovibrionales bacterium]